MPRDHHLLLPSYSQLIIQPTRKKLCTELTTAPWDRSSTDYKLKVTFLNTHVSIYLVLVLDFMYQFIVWCKQWRQKQIRRITDKVFDHFKNETGRANLNFEDLYIGVLLVYNDINKRLPGPHFDPPSKDLVKAMMQENDLNLDGEIDREEFAKFIKQLTADTFVVVSQGLILTLVAAPAVAMATKRATEGVPGVGKVVQRLPNSVYASLITLTVLLFQQARQEFD
ncbi:hypothetical protein DVH24_013763 [Malus domestica]|uniref:EF-hand domain-containing protein n=1 Tax=Malus domestica TaxID=3750 RepID=A0A498JED8_MALDO|nr:hypothetical protein DVH24_013763 [Malus domestica]